MRHIFAFALLALAVPAVGCVEYTPPDPFPERLRRGCSVSEQACQQLLQEAQGRAVVARCPPSRIGHVRCFQVLEDVRAAEGYARAWQERRAWQEQQAAAARAYAEAQQRAALEAAVRQQQEAQRRQHEELERERAEKEAAEAPQRAEALWLTLDLHGCSKYGRVDACEGIRAFMLGNPSSPHLQEASKAYQAGRVIIDRREAEEQAKRDEEKERRARGEIGRVVLPPGAKARPVQDTPVGRVCCCDGTLSPTCTTTDCGCCSHHGGVCTCR